MFETLREKLKYSNKKIILFIIFFFLFLFVLLIVAVSIKRPKEIKEPEKPPIVYRQRDHMGVSLKICNSKEGKEKELCFDQMKSNEASREENIKKCLDVGDFKIRDECIKTLAVYRNISNDKLCFSIADKVQRLTCLDWAIISKRDPGLCEKYFVGEPFEEQECKDRISAFELGEKGGKEAIFKCEEIKSLEYPNLCKWKNFETKFNNNCNDVPEEFRDYCFSYYIASDAKNETECANIPMEDHKKFCLLKVQAGGWENIGYLDSDSDGVTDWNELFMGLDPYNPDTDGDGLSDGEEMPIYGYGTNPKVRDTDGDGLSDYEEIMVYKTNPNKPDTDGDGISDGDEIKNGTNPNSGDADKDGLSDIDEIKYGTDPNNPDTDGDGMSDYEEVRDGFDPLVFGKVLSDTDGDGLLDIDEIFYGTDRLNPDTDGDGISDKDEVDNLTNPLGEGDMDFDGDGITDRDEIEIYKTNPSLADTDNDGLSDYEEIFIYKTNPRVKDTDGDGISDGEEVKNGSNPLV
ncbi:hypothetical protein K0B03_03730, partial [Patescibacteria group bacterium]|nr:hypothetical protein [Patescibacteria group bacterium]